MPAAVRSGMTELIRRLRLMIGDPAGAGEQFSSEELQSYLDRGRVEVRYAPLHAEPTFLPGGLVEYRDYFSGDADWEASLTLLDASYADVTSLLIPADAETNNPGGKLADLGKFVFSAHQAPPVFILGAHYDLNGAAADALDAWVAAEKDSIDFSSDGQSFHRSQRVATRERLAKKYRAMADVGVGRARSTDFNRDASPRY